MQNVDFQSWEWRWERGEGKMEEISKAAVGEVSKQHKQGLCGRGDGDATACVQESSMKTLLPMPPLTLYSLRGKTTPKSCNPRQG